MSKVITEITRITKIKNFKTLDYKSYSTGAYIAFKANSTRAYTLHNTLQPPPRGARSACPHAGATHTMQHNTHNIT